MDQLEEIRQKIDIVELISQHVTLKKAGRNFKALCPFHGEKTPSFIVSPERQIFKCFGCNIGGDIFKFLMEIEGLEFGEAIRELAQKANVELKDYRPTEEQQKKQRFLQINHLAGEYFHFILTQHRVGERARSYLKNRGIKNLSVKNFHLGYAPDSWEGLLDWLVRKKGYRYQELEAVGLAIRGRGWYARFRGRIIFPLLDLRGNILGFAGRVLDPKIKEAKYINSPETLLYHKSRHLYGMSTTKEFVRKKNQIVLVEGEMDTISSYQAGVKNVAAIKGSALTEEHLKLLKRFCETVVLALDADEAGQLAMTRSLDLVEEAGLNLKIVELPTGKDPDELAQKNSAKWRATVKQAVSVYDFVIDSAVKRFGKTSPEAKRKVSALVMPWLTRIQNEVVKSHFVKKLAGILGVEEEAVVSELIKQDKKNEVGGETTDQSSLKKERLSRRESLEQYLLALVVQASDWWSLLAKIKPTLIETFAYAKVFNRLRKMSKNLPATQLAKSLPEQLRAAFDNAFLLELPELLGKKWVQEVERVIKQLEKLKLYARLSQLRGSLGAVKKEKKKAALNQINQVLKRIQELGNG